MGIVASIQDRMQQLAVQRAPWVKAWAELADFCLPMAERMSGAYATSSIVDGLANGPKSTERGKVLYDSTSLWALDRLAAGMESLVTPQSDKWHGLGDNDPFAPEATDEEVEWFERLRDYQFAVRYDARAGFETAHQKALRCMVALGSAVLYVEEGFGADGIPAHRLPILYRYVPLSQNHLAVNAQGVADTNIRRQPMTPRQMVQRFGPRVPEKVRAWAENPKDCDRQLEVIHAVMPREERGSLRNSARSAPFASYYVCCETKTLIGEGGFFEFPFSVYYWQQSDESAYGESPAMLALADVKTLNAMAKTSLRASQQMVDPPLATSSDGVMNRPNLNARAINPGALDENGNLKIKPIVTVQAPTFAEAIMDQRREAIRESLYINLFQTLIQNPQMTATEAMIRANEKGELLGPAGSKIQQTMAFMSERELGLLERKGIYEPGTMLTPPESLAGRSFGVKFTSPLDLLRRQKELIGIQRSLEMALPIAQFQPEVMDNLDGDEIVRLAFEINGAPRKGMRRREEVEKVRAGRAQQQARMDQAAVLEAEGNAASAALPVMEAASAALGNDQSAAPRRR